MKSVRMYKVFFFFEKHFPLYNGQVKEHKVDGTRHLKYLIGTRVHVYPVRSCFPWCCNSLCRVCSGWIEKKNPSGPFHNVVVKAVVKRKK